MIFPPWPIVRRAAAGAWAWPDGQQYSLAIVLTGMQSVLCATPVLSAALATALLSQLMMLACNGLSIRTRGVQTFLSRYTRCIPGASEPWWST